MPLEGKQFKAIYRFMWEVLEIFCMCVVGQALKDLWYYMYSVSPMDEDGNTVHPWGEMRHESAPFASDKAPNLLNSVTSVRNVTQLLQVSNFQLFVTCAVVLAGRGVHGLCERSTRWNTVLKLSVFPVSRGQLTAGRGGGSVLNFPGDSLFSHTATCSVSKEERYLLPRDVFCRAAIIFVHCSYLFHCLLLFWFGQD